MKKQTKNIIIFLFFIYLLCIIKLTLLRDGYPYSPIKSINDIYHRLNNSNLDLFTSIYNYFDYGLRYIFIDGALSAPFKQFIVNILGNIIAFIPFSLLLAFILKKTKFVCLYGILFSILIECTQLYSGKGIFDIDDIILNGLGVIIGYILYLIIHFLLKYLNKRKKENLTL